MAFAIGLTNLLQIYYRIFQCKKKLKISEDLTEIWPRVCHGFFMDHHSVMKQQLFISPPSGWANNKPTLIACFLTWRIVVSSIQFILELHVDFRVLNFEDLTRLGLQVWRLGLHFLLSHGLHKTRVTVSYRVVDYDCVSFQTLGTTRLHVTKSWAWNDGRLKTITTLCILTLLKIQVQELNRESGITCSTVALLIQDGTHNFRTII